MSGSNALPEITLDELERLIRILGMLGSSSDGEVLSAARFAQRWVTEHATDWRTLLSPPEEALPVTGVVAIADPDEARTREAAAYDRGYREGIANGMQAMAAQVKAQANLQAGGLAGGPLHPIHPSWAAAAAQAATGHSPFTQPVRPAQAAQGPVQASGGLGGGAGGAGGWPAGSWQAVCAELLTRHAAVPGVLRSREETFVRDVLARGFPSLTPAQEAWLRDIAGRNGMSW